MDSENRICQNCGGGPLYLKKGIPSGSIYGPILLPGLGEVLQFAELEIVACENCGFVQFFITKSFRKNLAKTWKRISDSASMQRTPTPPERSDHECSPDAR